MKQVLRVRALNQPSVLPRICQVITRHGLKLESLLYQVTKDPNFVQFELTAASQESCCQLVKFLQRIIEVTDVDVQTVLD